MSRYQSIMRRLVDKVYVDANGCWIFTGSLDGTGYGQIYWNGRLHAAHRVSHELFVGPIPEGYEVDHWCLVHPCICPHHIEAVPPRINMLRSTAPAAERWRSGYCKRGHPKVEANMYYRKDRPGETECRACQLLHNLRRAKKNWDRTIQKYQFTGGTISVRF